VELILAERGIVVKHESIRHWCLKFGAEFAGSCAGDDHSAVIPGTSMRWPAASTVQHGVVLDILVQDRRNGTAARRFFKRLLQGLQYKPRRLVTDGLRSYGFAQRAILPHVRHRTSCHLSNRAENSHRPTRRHERQMQRFKSSDQAIPIDARHDLRTLPAATTPHARG